MSRTLNQDAQIDQSRRIEPPVASERPVADDAAAALDVMPLHPAAQLDSVLEEAARRRKAMAAVIGLWALSLLYFNVHPTSGSISRVPPGAYSSDSGDMAEAMMPTEVRSTAVEHEIDTVQQALASVEQDLTMLQQQRAENQREQELLRQKIETAQQKAVQAPEIPAPAAPSTALEVSPAPGAPVVAAISVRRYRPTYGSESLPTPKKSNPAPLFRPAQY